MLNNILNPDLYHGEKKKKAFFEGWYFKLVVSSKNYVFAFIPGISFSEDPHSFIQVLEGHNAKFQYIRYAVEDFTASNSNFNINIADNSFSLKSISLNIKGPTTQIIGTLNFSNIVKWPDSLINPGSMGFYNYLTFMQCYSQVCSITSQITGTLEVNGELIDFTGGMAYIEKNWGKDFPYSYLWTQCNNFSEKDVSLTASIGHIPFLFTSFTGFLVGLYVKGTFYKFTTINRSKIRIHSEENQLDVKVWSKDYSLSFTTIAPLQSFMNLYAPRNNTMLPIARESLMADTKLQLIDNKTSRTLLKSSGSYSGLEFSGNYKSLTL